MNSLWKRLLHSLGWPTAPERRGGSGRIVIEECTAGGPYTVPIPCALIESWGAGGSDAPTISGRATVWLNENGSAITRQSTVETSYEQLHRKA